MLPQMAGSVMHNTNRVSEGKTVVIQGYCTYANGDGSAGRVEYCDIYLFEQQALKKITSYIVETKEPVQEI
jgi:hypothetical protein